MRAKSNKSKGIKFENQVQKAINSGAVWFSPLDLDYNNYLVECKFTDRKGFRISLQLLEKLWNQALSMNKEPFLSVGIKRNEREVFIIDCNLRIQKR
jgi:hypothetical protein